MESESEEESEESEEESEDEEKIQQDGIMTPSEGLITPSGLGSAIPQGLETPDMIELRKKKIEMEMERYIFWHSLFICL